MRSVLKYKDISRRKFLGTTAVGMALAGVAAPNLAFGAAKTVKVGFLAPLRLGATISGARTCQAEPFAIARPTSSAKLAMDSRAYAARVVSVDSWPSRVDTTSSRTPRLRSAVAMLRRSVWGVDEVPGLFEALAAKDRDRTGRRPV